MRTKQEKFNAFANFFSLLSKMFAFLYSAFVLVLLDAPFILWIIWTVLQVSVIYSTIFFFVAFVVGKKEDK